MRTWAVCIALALPIAGAVWLGVPFWVALVAAMVFLFATIGNGPARMWGRVALLPVLVLAAVLAVGHAAAGPAPAAPAVVTWQPGTYSSYGSPSFTVGVMNEGASPATLHTTIRVRFVNDRTAQVITEVTEPVNVTVPAGQGQTLTYSAPQAVAGPAGPAVTDRSISVTPEDS